VCTLVAFSLSLVSFISSISGHFEIFVVMTKMNGAQIMMALINFTNVCTALVIYSTSNDKNSFPIVAGMFVYPISLILHGLEFVFFTWGSEIINVK
ncbi:MAG: hypothetical protein MHPSP_001107, partial [Paramarteilia canceri]